MVGVSGIGFEDRAMQDMIALDRPDLGLRALNPHRETDPGAAMWLAKA